MTTFSYSDTTSDLRLKVSKWIKEKYSELLGEKIRLLDHPHGLEMLQKFVQQRLFELKTKTN